MSNTPIVLDKTVYSVSATAVAGRAGKVTTDDGSLDLELVMPGSGKPGPVFARVRPLFTAMKGRMKASTYVCQYQCLLPNTLRRALQVERKKIKSSRIKYSAMSGTMSLAWSKSENPAWSVVELGDSLTFFATRLCTLALS